MTLVSNTYPIHLQVNGQQLECRTRADETLLAVLRRLGFVEVKLGCGSGECGVCTVRLDGQPVNACLVLAVDCNGSQVLTTAGMGSLVAPSKLQRRLVETGAVQCGFCTPGLISAVSPLVERNTLVTIEDIEEALDGHLCRCTGYVKQREAVLACCREGKAKVAARSLQDSTDNGEPVKSDALAMACGSARYTEDFVPDEVLTLAVVGSTKPHAIVKAIDVAKARAMDGVIEILTAQSLPPSPSTEAEGLASFTATGDNYLLTLQPRFLGDRVAAVIAHSERAARAACRAVQIEYEERPAVCSVEAALAVDATVIGTGTTNLVGQLDYERGKPLESPAPIQIAERYRTAAVSPCFAEPFACQTWLDEQGRLVVRTSTQVPFFVRQTVAALCGLPLSQIRVVKPRVGGGFGAKQDCVVEALCAWATLAVGRPVRYVYSRNEVFRSGRCRHPMETKVEASATADGKLASLTMDMTLDTGAYPLHGASVLLCAASRSLPLYRWPQLSFHGRSVLTNRAPSTGIRGYGAPQAYFALEGAIDDLARTGGFCPLQLRLDNCVTAGASLAVINDLAAQTGVVPDQLPAGPGLEACLRQGAAAIRWTKRRLPPDPVARLRRGIGLACAMQGPTALDMMHSSATATLTEDGSVIVLTGAADIGTGCETTLRQIVATELQVPPARITIVAGDTDLCPFDSGAYASSTMWNAGEAVRKAAQQLSTKLVATVADWEALPPGQLEVRHGAVHTRGPQGERLYDFREIGLGSLHRRLPSRLSATVSHAPSLVEPAFAAVFVYLEVDCATGMVRILDTVVAVDCGRPINRTLVEGQLQGGVAMGLGAALTEELRFNQKGFLINGNLSTYQVARMIDSPPIRVCLVSGDDEARPAKSVGEIGTMPAAAAVAAAIAHAIGQPLRCLPQTPWRILDTLADTAAKGAPDEQRHTSS